jgi:hypothetical protein
MKRHFAISILLLASGFALAQLGGMAPPRTKDAPLTARVLVGQVLDKSTENPVAEAVVHLKNTKTLTEKTYIADKDGNYRFAALSPNVDYEVYAVYQGKKSDTKTLSAFDSRPKAVINLKVDAGKK